jgi:hypothetical protein
MTEEVDEMPAVLLEYFRCKLLALLGGCEDEHIHATVPERLLVLVPRFHLLAAPAKTIHHPEDAADQA